MNKKQTVIEKFLEKPERMRMGAGKLSKRYKTDRDTIIEARKEVRNILKLESNNGFPKILIFDIETAPLLAYVWQHSVWNTNISENYIISEWFMLTWCAKWLFDNEMMSAKLTKKEALDEDDSRITEGIWKLFNEADIVIAHNAKKFDIPNLQTRFLVNGLSPTKPYRQIDTLLVARREFGFTHNNLNALSRVLGLGQKTDTNIQLWKDCRLGNERALKEMETYNKQDVLLLEEVYLSLLPWIKSHPNIGLYLDSEVSVCSNCGSNKLQENGLYITNASKFKAFKCKSCGAISRARTNCNNKQQTKSLLMPIAR